MIALALVLTLQAADVDARTREILADPAYAFCHEPDYPLTREEATWCPVLETQGVPACPSFVKTCAAARAELDNSGRFTARTRGEGKAAPEKKAQRADGSGQRRTAEQKPEEETRIPDLGGLAAVLFWMVIAAAIGVVAWLVAKNLADRKRKPELVEPEPIVGEAVDDGEQRAAQHAMLTDVEALLRAAQDAELRGHLALAIDLGHAALLRRLDHEGVIHLHRARTHGEYLVDLREHPGWREPVRAVFREVDRIQFGASAPEPTHVRTVLERIAALARSGAATVLALVLSVIACDVAQESFPWRTSPSGNDGVIEWLRKGGAEVSWRESSLHAIARGGVIVLLENSAPDDEEWNALRTWVRDGGRLVIAGRVTTPAWIDGEIVGAPYADATLPGPPWLPGNATVVGDAWGSETLIERAETDYAVEHNEGLGTVVVLADHHLFTNAGLAVGASAAWLPIVIDGRRRIELVDAWTGTGADTPLETITNSHLTAAIVQLLLLLLALYLWRGWPFARPRDPPRTIGRGFADHARAMGLQYERAHAEGHAAGVYSTFALETLRREASGAGAGLHALAQSLARRTGRDETELMRLLVEIHGGSETSRIGNTSGLDLATVRALAQLLRQTSPDGPTKGES